MNQYFQENPEVRKVLYLHWVLWHQVFQMNHVFQHLQQDLADLIDPVHRDFQRTLRHLEVLVCQHFPWALLLQLIPCHQVCPRDQQVQCFPVVLLDQRIPVTQTIQIYQDHQHLQQVLLVLKVLVVLADQQAQVVRNLLEVLLNHAILGCPQDRVCLYHQWYL